MKLNRRDLLRSLAFAAPAAYAQQAPPSKGLYTGSSTAHRLLGKRLVFTNWYYIEHGRFRWENQRGNAVTLDDSLAPGEAHQHRYDMASGIRLTVEKPHRMGPLLEPTARWEEDAGVILTTVFKDGGMYRGWGTPFCTSGLPKGQSVTYYLESNDGVTWKRPNLGLIEYKGSKKNNIVIPLDPRQQRTSIMEPIFSGTVFLDRSAPAAERYKMFALGYTSKEAFESWSRRHERDWSWLKGMSLRGAVSPDGLSWKILSDPLSVEYSDTHVVGLYDQNLKKYVGYTRKLIDGRRAIGRSETEDFRDFPPSEVIVEGGIEIEPTDSYYTNGRTNIPGAPDHHLLFPAIYHLPSDSMSIGIASSHDGRYWHFLNRSPIFEPGPFGAWDGGLIFAHPNLIELPNGDFAMPYSGYSVPHKYPRGQWQFKPGYMIWPKGRLIGIEAPEQGEFATVRFFPPGRTLRLNVLTRRTSKVQVEVARPDGTPVPGRTFADSTPIFGDQRNAPVVWKGQEDLGHPEGSDIFLRFRLDQACIYGLEFV
jgi:hypothetical protein